MALNAAELQEMATLANQLGDDQAELEALEGLERLGALQQDPSAFQEVAGGLETAATFVTGALAEPLSGVAGLATTALTGDPEAGEAVLAGVQETLTFDPRTDAGKRNLESIGGSDGY